MLNPLGICQCFCTSSAQTADTMLSTERLYSWVMLFLSGHKQMACEHKQLQPLTVFSPRLFRSLPPFVPLQSAFLLTNGCWVSKASFTRTHTFMCTRRHTCAVTCSAVQAFSAASQCLHGSHAIPTFIRRFHLERLMMRASCPLSLFFAPFL